MRRRMMKSKIHRATVTGAELDYAGSISLDTDLMQRADILAFEQVAVLDIDNGNRFETYAIAGEHGSGAIVLNGAVAHLGRPGDILTIMSFIQVDESLAKTWKPRVIVLGAGNKILSERGI
jgi:aspartate 1-decarboxylase